MNNCFSCSPYAFYDPYYDFYNPYYGYASAFNPYWGGGFYARNWNRPYRVVYVDNDDYRANYGKRASRSSQLSRDNDMGTRGNGRVAEGRGANRTNSGGRVNTNREQEYYNNSWRNTNRSNTNTNSSYTAPRRVVTPNWNNSDNNSNSNSRSSWESQQRSTPSYSPSRSSDAGRSYTPPSSGGGGGSNGSGSRSSRGRN